MSSAPPTTEPAPLTDAEAEALLVRLSAHFRTPVMPITRYCAALRTYQGAIYDRAERLKIELYPGIDGPSTSEAAQAAFAKFTEERDAPEPTLIGRNRRHYDVARLRDYERESDAVSGVFQQISKSALLDRLLYRGEPLRTRMCPEHKGRWSGLEWGPENACPHGCQLTGWLPEPAVGPTVAIVGTDGAVLGTVPAT